MSRILARGRSAGAALHSRLCAAVTAGSCLVHLWLVAENQHGPWLNVVMVAMVAVCFPCTVHIWRRLRVGALQRVMVSALAMAVLHAFLFLGAGPAGHSHTSPAAAVTGPGGYSAAMSLAVIGLEITTALLAATLVARLRCRSVPRRSCQENEERFEVVPAGAVAHDDDSEAADGVEPHGVPEARTGAEMLHPLT